MTADGLQARAETLSKTMFVGGPVKAFTSDGRMQLSTLLREGLWPQARVLDVGCGCLRDGYWLMHFLDPGCYFGIEPNAEMLQAGLDTILEPETRDRAAARFSHNDAFDFSGFGVTFDFVLARSVWSHASNRQIETMLDSFTAAAPTGILLASYLPADVLRTLPARLPALARRLPSVGQGDGDAWVGRSHLSDVPGRVRHSFRSLTMACEQRGLGIRQLGHGVVNRQPWLRIERPR